MIRKLIILLVDYYGHKLYMRQFLPAKIDSETT